MHKKDYIRIAKVISESKTVEDVAKKLCLVLREDNELFNSVKFLEACKKKKAIPRYYYSIITCPYCKKADINFMSH